MRCGDARVGRHAPAQSMHHTSARILLRFANTIMRWRPASFACVGNAKDTPSLFLLTRRHSSGNGLFGHMCSQCRLSTVVPCDTNTAWAHCERNSTNALPTSRGLAAISLLFHVCLPFPYRFLRWREHHVFVNAGSTACKPLCAGAADGCRSAERRHASGAIRQCSAGHCSDRPAR